MLNSSIVMRSVPAPGDCLKKSEPGNAVTIVVYGFEGSVSFPKS